MTLAAEAMTTVNVLKRISYEELTEYARILDIFQRGQRQIENSNRIAPSPKALGFSTS